MIMWPHRMEADYREPLITFTLPSITNGIVTNGGRYGFFMLSIPTWIELLMLIAFQMVFAYITAVFIYKLIIEPKRTDTTFSTILGFGVILPFWIFCPLKIMEWLDVRQFLLKFCLGIITPTLSIFRTTEAIYGFAPPASTRSIHDFTLYFTSVLIFSRNDDNNGKKDGNGGTLIKYPMEKTLGHGINFAKYLLICGAYQSFLTLYEDAIVFGERPTTYSEWTSVDRFWTWELYANNILQAVVFQLYLTTYCEGLTFLWTLCTGYQVEPVMKNPLFESKSPSDFWGRRWNLLIHSVLKGGVYKPVRKFTSSIGLAVIAVFLASGAFHEWLVYIVLNIPTRTIVEEEECSMNNNKETNECFKPILGGAMIFFIWQATLVVGEVVLFSGQSTNNNNKKITNFFKNIPTPVRTALVIAMGLPAAHFFCEPYFRSNFFLHGQVLLPMIRKVD